MLLNSRQSYGLVLILFHWVVAILFLGQIGLGYYMTRTSDFALKFNLFQLHKSIGFLILLLSAMRLVWKLINVTPARLAGTGRIQHLAARAVQVTLYASLFILPLTGWAIASSSPLNIPTMIFSVLVVPALPIMVSESAEAFWVSTHTYIAYISAGIATGHILAALHHHLWKHDATLKRMLKPTAFTDNE